MELYRLVLHPAMSRSDHTDLGLPRKKPTGPFPCCWGKNRGDQPRGGSPSDPGTRRQIRLHFFFFFFFFSITSNSGFAT